MILLLQQGSVALHGFVKASPSACKRITLQISFSLTWLPVVCVLRCISLTKSRNRTSFGNAVTHLLASIAVRLLLAGLSELRTTDKKLSFACVILFIYLFFIFYFFVISSVNLCLMVIFPKATRHEDAAEMSLRASCGEVPPRVRVSSFD